MQDVECWTVGTHLQVTLDIAKQGNVANTSDDQEEGRTNEDDKGKEGGYC